jgi:tRNA (guanosine-2'-O-)-methyltransferase
MSAVERFLRMQVVLDQRLSLVHCAAEAVYSRHNVSAILRSCDAFGLQHVHLVGGNFTATRGASRGAERWLTVHRHETADRAIDMLRARGVRLFVADFAEDALTPEELPLDEPICVWMGAELAGVSPVARAAADGVVKVPMRGFSQSLNVSVAAAVTLRPLTERARTLGAAALLPAEERQALLRSWVERDDPHGLAIEARAALRLV